METVASVSFSFGVIAYSVASTFFFLHLIRKRAPVSTTVSTAVLAIGALFHSLHIVAASLFTRICPVESIHFALSLAGLVTVGAFLILGRNRKLEAMGVFVAPLALTFFIASQFIGQATRQPELSRAMLAFHVTANLVGIGFVLLAGGASAFYVFTERRLKAKRLGAAARLPSLESLDKIGHRLLLIGFPLLTFGVVTGGMFISQMDVSNVTSFLRAVLGYLTWALVAAVLLLRAIAGWRGRRTAYGILVGVLCVSLVLLVYLLRPLWGNLA